VVIVFAVAAIARDFRLVQFGLPENRRQVPRTIFRKAPPSAFFQFGFELGTGVRTRLPATTAHVTAVALLLLAPGLILTVLVGAVFGLGRAMMPLARHLSADQHGWDETLRRTKRLTVRASVAAAGIAVVVLALA
jgi:hypothetical protein